MDYDCSMKNELLILQKHAWTSNAEWMKPESQGYTELILMISLQR